MKEITLKKTFIANSSFGIGLDIRCQTSQGHKRLSWECSQGRHGCCHLCCHPVHVLTEHHAPWPSPEQQTYNVQTHLVNCSTDWRPPPARAHPFKRFLDKVPDPQTGDRLLHRASMGNTRKKGVEIFQLNVYFWILPPQLASVRLPAKHASECSATYTRCAGQVFAEEFRYRAGNEVEDDRTVEKRGSATA